MTLLRHTFALLASVFVVAVVWLGVSTWLSPAVSIDWRAGGQIFDDRCAGCHSIEPSESSGYGPNLAAIGRVAADRVPGLSAEDYLIQSIVAPGAFRASSADGVMPEGASAGMSGEDVVNVVAYLVGLTAQPDYRRLAKLSGGIHTAEPTEGRSVRALDAEMGRQLFLGRCAGCHGLRDLPGAALRAPLLVGTGRHSVDYLVESIRDPSRVIVPGYETWSVVTRAGALVTGRLMRDTPEQIVILLEGVHAGDAESLARSDIATDDQGRPRIERVPTSAMPAGLLSPSEIPLVVEFLRSL